MSVRSAFLRGTVGLALLAGAVACGNPPTAGPLVLQLAAQWTPPAGPTTVVTPLPDSVRVRVTDAGGRPQVDARVVFVVTDGGGAVSARSLRTGASGTAAVRWTLGATAGVQRVRAFSPDAPTGEFVDFTVTTVAGPAASVSATVGVFAINLGDSTVSIVRFRDAAGVSVPAPGPVTYSVADTAIARVRSDGRIVGVAIGMTVLTVSSGGLSDTAIVRVRAGPPTLATQAFSGRFTYKYSFVESGVAYAPDVLGRDVWRFIGSTQTVLGPPLLLNALTLEVVASPSGSVVISNAVSPELHVIDHATFTLDRVIPVASRPVRMVLNAAATILYVSYETGGIARVDLTTDAVTNLAVPGGVHNGLALSPDESALFVSSTDGWVRRVATASFTVTHAVQPLGTPQAVALGMDGERLFVARETGTALVLRASDLVQIGALTMGSGLFDVAVSADGAYVIGTASHAGRVQIFDVLTFELYGQAEVPFTLRRISRDPATGAYWVGSESGSALRLTF